MPRDRIDVHAHYLGGTVEALFASGFTLAGGYRIPAGWTPEGALAFMDRHEIATQILSAPWPFAGTDEDPEFARRFRRSVNREYAELIAAYPGRFGAFTAVPLDSPDAVLAEIAYGLDELGLDGVMLTSNSVGQYFGQPFYEPVLAELARREVPVFLHPTDCPHVDVLGLGGVFTSRTAPTAPGTHSRPTGRKPKYVQYERLPPGTPRARTGHRGHRTGCEDTP
ncbi:amidohydrolase family protein [Streptomyces albidoflavus]